MTTQGTSHEPSYDLVVIAASAGGIPALQQVLGAFPADFPVPVAIVQHRTGKNHERLATILGRHTPLCVKNVEAGETLHRGTVYLAPADLHLSLGEGGVVCLSNGTRIRHVRSSANPLFASAAEAFDGRVVAVVLTGSASDGTDGVQSVKARGGFVIAQDEATSEVFGMPRSAIETGCVDRVLPLPEIGPAVLRLVETGAV